MPMGKTVKIGVWEGIKFIGVIIFSMGTSKDIGTKYGLSQFEACELTRIALATHENTVTKMMSIALKLLKKQSPNLKLVVSFADPEEGHEGTIYKAGNWIKDGFSTKLEAFIVGGRKVTSRSYHELTKKGITGEKIKIQPKHKFIYALDKKWYKDYCVSSEKVSRSTSIENRRGSTDPDAP